jgi:transposase InsO family protein
MDARREFVALAAQEGANLSGLARRFGISRKTAYKWLGRARHARAETASGGEALALALSDRSRRPHRSPTRTPAALEQRVLAIRDAHPAWGGRKIAARLRALDSAAAGPAPSTITAILRRHDRLDAAEAGRPRAFVRFEHAAPNRLWQMDFKGHFACTDGARPRCHPLTVLDDHSRFMLCLQACGDERAATVRRHLQGAFERYGLPDRMAVDNGAPWGNGADDRYTPLVVWLLRLGIPVSHSRPYHPQTLGKDERFHRTLKAELLAGRGFADLAACQTAFDRWRAVYNHERPHEALGLAVPASRYRVSARPWPGEPGEPAYAPDVQVRRVQQGGWVSFLGHALRLPKAFCGLPVGFRATLTDGCWDVLFAAERLLQVDLRRTGDTAQPVTHLPEHL